MIANQANRPKSLQYFKRMRIMGFGSRVSSMMEIQVFVDNWQVTLTIKSRSRHNQGFSYGILDQHNLMSLWPEIEVSLKQNSGPVTFVECYNDLFQDLISSLQSIMIWS